MRLRTSAEAPWRLALITLMQFGENLTDRQAADAARSRVDWKYVLGLELTDPGFHYSVLCEFRCRLIAGATEQLLFETLLKLFQERGWLKERSRQRTDSTNIVAAVRKLNRVELVGEALYHALDVLAQLAPDWLKAHSQPDWYALYSQRPTGFRLAKSEAEQLALAEQIGRDGWHLQPILAYLTQGCPDELSRNGQTRGIKRDRMGVYWSWCHCNSVVNTSRKPMESLLALIRRKE